MENNGPKLKIHTLLTPIAATPGYVKLLRWTCRKSIKGFAPPKGGSKSHERINYSRRSCASAGPAS
jgi:hypothetical protein